MRKTIKIFFLALFLLSLPLFWVLIGSITNPISNLQVTSVKDSSASVVWTSEKPNRALVIYWNVENSSLFKAILEGNLAYDDHAMMEGERGIYRYISERDLTRLAHHNTMRDLDSKTGYAYAIVSWGGVHYSKQDVFTTGETLSQVALPDPFYGLVQGDIVSDGYIVYERKNGFDPLRVSQKLSAPIYKGSYSLDLSNLLDKEETELFELTDENDTQVVSYFYNIDGNLVSGAMEVAPDADQPVPLIQHDTNDIALQSYFSPLNESLTSLQGNLEIISYAGGGGSTPSCGGNEFQKSSGPNDNDCRAWCEAHEGANLCASHGATCNDSIRNGWILCTPDTTGGEGYKGVPPQCIYGTDKFTNPTKCYKDCGEGYIEAEIEATNVPGVGCCILDRWKDNHSACSPGVVAASPPSASDTGEISGGGGGAAENSPPRIVGSLPVWRIHNCKPFSFTLDKNMVVDDDGDSLTFKVYLEDSNLLPAFMRFDSKSLTLSNVEHSDSISYGQGSQVLFISISDGKEEITEELDVMVVGDSICSSLESSDSIVAYDTANLVLSAMQSECKYFDNNCGGDTGCFYETNTSRCFPNGLIQECIDATQNNDFCTENLFLAVDNTSLAASFAEKAFIVKYIPPGDLLTIANFETEDTEATLNAMQSQCKLLEQDRSCESQEPECIYNDKAKRCFPRSLSEGECKGANRDFAAFCSLPMLINTVYNIQGSPNIEAESFIRNYLAQKSLPTRCDIPGFETYERFEVDGSGNVYCVSSRIFPQNPSLCEAIKVDHESKTYSFVDFACKPSQNPNSQATEASECSDSGIYLTSLTTAMQGRCALFEDMLSCDIHNRNIGASNQGNWGCLWSLGLNKCLMDNVYRSAAEPCLTLTCSSAQTCLDGMGSSSLEDYISQLTTPEENCEWTTGVFGDVDYNKYVVINSSDKYCVSTSPYTNPNFNVGPGFCKAIKYLPTTQSYVFTGILCEEVGIVPVDIPGVAEVSRSNNDGLASLLDACSNKSQEQVCRFWANLYSLSTEASPEKINEVIALLAGTQDICDSANTSPLYNYGIRCTGSVISGIDLSGRNLDGEISGAILPTEPSNEFNVLSLSNNAQLSGGFGEVQLNTIFPNLNSLYLENTQLGGDLGYLAGGFLILSHCNLAGTEYNTDSLFNINWASSIGKCAASLNSDSGALWPGSLVFPAKARTFDQNDAPDYLAPGYYLLQVNQIEARDYEITEDTVINYYYDLNGNGHKDSDEKYIQSADVKNLQVAFKKRADITGLNLKTGWNLIHFPMVMKGEFTSNIARAGDLLAGLNKSGMGATHLTTYRDGKFLVFSQDLTGGQPQQYGNNFAILPGEGYFVKVKKSGMMTIKGNYVDGSLNLNMVNGWNLVGIYNSAQPKFDVFGTLKAMNTQGVKAEVISMWEDGLYRNAVSKDGMDYGLTFDVLPQRGYWVRVDGEGVKTFSP